MKIATLILRVLLGFIYLVFGLDYFLHFIPYQPEHTGNVAALKSGLMGTGYIYPMMKSIQILGGISLMVNRWPAFFAWLDQSNVTVAQGVAPINFSDRWDLCQ